MLKYPNLDLIEYKFKTWATTEYKDLLKNVYPKFRAYVFLQTWPNTARGFDADGGFSGQAFTDEYTTVIKMTLIDAKTIKEKDDEIYGVFFGNDIAYAFLNPNPKFFEDVNNRCMESQRGSGKYL